MPHYEFAQSIAPGIRPSFDRPEGQIPPQVRGECRGRGVAPFGLVRQRLHGDRVEVALEPPCPPLPLDTLFTRYGGAPRPRRGAVSGFALAPGGPLLRGRG